MIIRLLKTALGKYAFCRNRFDTGTNGLGLLEQNFVETSNVNVVEELVSMIQTQRAYEMNSKSIETSDQMLQRLAQL